MGNQVTVCATTAALFCAISARIEGEERGKVTGLTQNQVEICEGTADGMP